MSSWSDDGGSTPTPPPPPPPPPPPSGAEAPPKRTRRWPVIVGIGSVLVIGGAVAGFTLLGEESGPDHPDVWDERVAHLVEFVEDERGLAFEHPVHIDFLDDAAWEAQGSVDEEELTPEDEALLEHGAGLFRALGLAEGELDLLQDSEDLAISGVLGQYRFEDERIVVHGTEVTRAVEATLVHELTHVLQDQHFDIGTRIPAASEDEGSEEGSLRVLVEGDADRIEDRWIEQLSEEDRTALEEEREAESEEGMEVIDELPASLVTFFSSDYILGAGFIDVVEAHDGDDGIDRAFRVPPGPEEHVFDPLSFLQADTEESVDPPEIDGEAIADMEGDFGVTSWYLFLAERTDPVAALTAVEGWASDAFRGYVRDDVTCAALRFVGEDRAAAAVMATRLEQWAASMPEAAQATVVHDGRTVDLDSCDPGTEADLVEDNGRSQETIILPAVRSQLASQVLNDGGNAAQARCFSSGVVAGLPYELLVSDASSPEQQRQIQRLAARFAASCR